VLFSVNDLTFAAEVPKYQESSILVTCASADSGVVKIDNTTLAEFDLLLDGHSLISSILFGPDTVVTVYTGGNFDGDSQVIRKPTSSSGVSLVEKVYGTGKRSANDNVKSFELTSGSSSLSKCNEAMQVDEYADQRLDSVGRKDAKNIKKNTNKQSKNTDNHDKKTAGARQNSNRLRLRS
jgi:hypothetical protein